MESRSSLPLCLGAIAFVVSVAAISAASDVVDAAVDQSLRDVDTVLPPEAEAFARAAAVLVPATLAFLFVYAVASCFACGTQRERVPMGIPVSDVPYVDMSSYKPSPFADGICSCCNDPKLCVATLCCPFVPVGQLWERVMWPRAPAGSFWYVFLGLFFFSAFSGSAVSLCPQPQLECTTDAHGVVSCSTLALQPASTLCTLGTAGQSLVSLALVALVAAIRSRVRLLHAIPPSCCGALDDVCCACWCLPFETCRLLRHLGTVEGTRYKFFSTTGVATAV